MLNPEQSELYFHVAERPLFWYSSKKNDHFAVPTHKALVRMLDDEPVTLAVVGEGYKTVQNQELFTHVSNVLEDTFSHDDLEGATVSDAMSYNGASSFRTYRFNNVTMRVGNRDIVFQVTVVNGFGKSGIHFIYGAYELICTNGMMIGECDRIVRRHTKGLEIPALAETLRGCLDVYYKAATEYDRWSRIDVDDQQVVDLLDNAPSISDRLADQLFNQWLTEKDERGGNAYALYSALTEYASHDNVVPIRRTGNDHIEHTRMTRHREVNRVISSRAWRDHVLKEAA